MAKENPHLNHRERLKERFMQFGLEGFEPHQVLELALFFAIPRKDTNPIAHRLLKRFGSLADVFNAPAAELIKVEGIGQHAALFLKLQHGLLLRYQQCLHTPRTSFQQHNNCVSFFTEKMMYLAQEEFQVLCLDASLRLIKHLTLFRGTVNSTSVNLRDFTAQVLWLDTAAVIVAHNHPSGVAAPSPDDMLLTETLLMSLKYQDIDLLDHIIISPQGYYSFYKQNIIQQLKEKINLKVPKLFAAQKTGDFI